MDLEMERQCEAGYGDNSVLGDINLREVVMAHMSVYISKSDRLSPPQLAELSAATRCPSIIRTAVKTMVSVAASSKSHQSDRPGCL